MNNFQEKVSFIWSVADLLRGDYKQSEYGKVILPLTVLRRLDCVLEPTKKNLLEKAKKLPKKADEAMKHMMLCQAAGPNMTFYNTSRFVFSTSSSVCLKIQPINGIEPSMGTRRTVSLTSSRMSPLSMAVSPSGTVTVVVISRLAVIGARSSSIEP